MTTARAKELQENIAKEAVTLLVIYGEVNTDHYAQSIELIGKAGNVPSETTAQWLELIASERQANLTGTPHTMHESDLPMNATGLETLENIWGLFEAAIQLADAGSRAVLYNLAHELEETQNLLDWIEKTPEERLAWMPPVGQPLVVGA